jgi:hypothetical protein
MKNYVMSERIDEKVLPSERDFKKYKYLLLIFAYLIPLIFAYLIPLILLIKFSFYPSLYSYDSNGHVLVSDYIIANFHFPDIHTWIKLGPSGSGMLPLFNCFFSITSISTNISTYYIGKYIFPALSFTLIFIFACLILKSLDKAKLAFPFLILCLFIYTYIYICLLNLKKLG